jgi:hypothetical protein
VTYLNDVSPSVYGNSLTLYFDLNQVFSEARCVPLLDKLSSLDYYHFMLHGSDATYQVVLPLCFRNFFSSVYCQVYYRAPSLVLIYLTFLLMTFCCN